MERYDAKDKYHAWYEHWHRYHWISPWVKDKIVADLACGEGFGSALLAQTANQVLAMDIDSATIDRAKVKYQSRPNLQYITADVLKSPLASDSLDVVVSFETLEHLTAHQQLLKEFKRQLKRDGIMILSTPDKAVYSGSEHHNQYHVKELEEKEFKALVNSHFKHVIFFGQQLQTSSQIEPMMENESQTAINTSYLNQGDEFGTFKKTAAPTYLIAIASDSLRAVEPFYMIGSHHFNDVNNSLFEHYEEQVVRLLEADQTIANLKHQTEIQIKVISQLKARLGI